MITSTSNQRIKEIVQLQKKNRARNTEGVFIVEGIRMVREIPEDKLKALYVTEEFYKKHKAELPGNVKPELQIQKHLKGYWQLYGRINTRWQIF